ncbi:hypothetical protein BHE74_00043783 [Ensete ventricosum]|nr:hypothetical protein BHE74_00043783 [Ensete ventricosum]
MDFFVCAPSSFASPLLLPATSDPGDYPLLGQHRHSPLSPPADFKRGHPPPALSPVLTQITVDRMVVRTKPEAIPDPPSPSSTSVSPSSTHDNCSARATIVLGADQRRPQ